MLTLGLHGHPGALVAPAQYEAMKAAILRALPGDGPGFTWDELVAALHPHLGGELFPNEGLALWYANTVQLDLEARGLVARLPGRPARLRQVSPRGVS